MKYTALQVKTSYSILNSLNNIEKLVKEAKSLGYTSLAITDHNNMFGVPEFYHTCLKYNLKPIIGLELSIDNKNILLYAINNKGYNNLVKLSTIVSEKDITIEIISKYKDNLLLILTYKYYDKEIYELFEYKYIGYSTKEEKEIIKEDKVLINDVSYINKDDYKYLDYLYMIKELKTLGEYELNTHKGKHLLKEEEILELSDERDIINTNTIKDMCNVELALNKNLLPIYDETKDAYEYLKYLCHKGLNKRLNNSVPKKYQDRLEYELKIIN